MREDERGRERASFGIFFYVVLCVYARVYVN